MFFSAICICPAEILATKPSSLRELCIHHLHTKIAFTTAADDRSMYFDYTPQISVIPKLDTPAVFKAELLVLNDQCGLHNDQNSGIKLRIKRLM